ncbi:hypothetical protein BH23ACT2_BH23ACT2_26020 [soil metagenome]
MPLGEVGEYRAWIDRESPSRAAQSVARSFIAELGERPWREPSVPIPELSNQPEYEIRTAILAVSGDHGIQVWYLHAYATGNVDVIAVTNR